jgi:hypothetical protein
VCFCFHGDDKHTLPLWVLQEGQACPDIFFTDRAGVRNLSCLSIGVDNGERSMGGRGVAALQARTSARARMRRSCLFAASVQRPPSCCAR